MFKSLKETLFNWPLMRANSTLATVAAISIGEIPFVVTFMFGKIFPSIISLSWRFRLVRQLFKVSGVIPNALASLIFSETDVYCNAAVILYMTSLDVTGLGVNLWQNYDLYFVHVANTYFFFRVFTVIFYSTTIYFSIWEYAVLLLFQSLNKYKSPEFFDFTVVF